MPPVRRSAVSRSLRRRGPSRLYRGRIRVALRLPPTELRARLNAAGLTQVLINSPAGNRTAGERGMACVPGRAAAFRDGLAQALDYAVALDCKLVHVMAGVPPQDVAHDTAAALYAANLAWAAEKALGAGVSLVIEPLNPRDAPFAAHTGAGCGLDPDRGTSMDVDGRDVPLSPSMVVTVEIKTGAQQVITDLLSPLLRFRQNSPHER